MFNNYIYYSDEPLLSQEFCDKLIAKFNNDKDVHQGVCGHKDGPPQVNLDIKQSIDLHIYNNRKYHFESQQLQRVILKTLATYSDLVTEQCPDLVYPLFRKNSYITGFNIQKTTPGGFFKWHSDDYYDPNAHEGYWRAISYLIYLNDVEEGGETEFVDGFKALPKRGHVCFFPCTWSYVHRGCPPISNDKYIIAGWWMTNASMASQRASITEAERNEMSEKEYSIRSRLHSYDRDNKEREKFYRNNMI
tara:strand:+ start:103 stop:846 length:744 start_codon:yes stop_codon:yes gene_type:complete